MLTKICLLLLLFKIDSINVIEIRNLYEIAADDKQANKKLIALLMPVKNDDALLTGYKGAAIMMEANHVFNPITKLSRFNKGKQLIENAIRKDGSNVELRYIRLTIQTNIPGFLGYSNAIEADKKLLINKLEGIKDRDLKNRIENYLQRIKIWKNK
ncbi:hypothetical protein WG904_16255 [Pedobacter sp. Du54]|uniref:hypothetical protein n=1 Tax=Pedobacter anseongensis TaxID=3133439 RepID=UPI0030A277C0